MTLTISVRYAVQLVFSPLSEAGEVRARQRVRADVVMGGDPYWDEDSVVVYRQLVQLFYNLSHAGGFGPTLFEGELEGRVVDVKKYSVVL